MRIRRLAATGAILALSLGVAACSNEAEPTVAPSTTAEATTEAATSAAETTAPAPDVPKPDPADFPGKDEQTEEGAKEAVRYYWAMLLWGYQTGEVEEFQALYVESCGNCIENAELIEGIGDSGHYWSYLKVEDDDPFVSTQESDVLIIQYNFNLGAHTEPSGTGPDGEDVPEKRYLTGAKVEWVDGEWKIASVNFEVKKL